MTGRRLLRLVVLGMFSTGAAACSDYSMAPAPPPPPPPPPAVQLKDVVIPHLPSPYYHFEYDAGGRIALVSFASEVTNYDVTYAGGRIAELQNNRLVNHDRLVYVYDDSARVSLIKEIDDAGGTFMLISLSYHGAKLTGLERDKRVQGGFIIDKTMAFTYDGDGNLLELTEHRPAITGLQDEQTVVDRFEQYDTGVNVDGFELLHDDFSDHLVLLPEVQLQRGNPRHQTRTGDADNFVLDYTYTYDDRSRPISKQGQLTYTSGPNVGRQFQVGSTFTYY